LIHNSIKIILPHAGDTGGSPDGGGTGSFIQNHAYFSKIPAGHSSIQRNTAETGTELDMLQDCSCSKDRRARVYPFPGRLSSYFVIIYKVLQKRCIPRTPPGPFPHARTLAGQNKQLRISRFQKV